MLRYRLKKRRWILPRCAIPSTKVFILEVMGRNAGWIAAAGGLAAQQEGDGPHIIVFPEIDFNRQKFLRRVKQCVKKYGYCAIVASEGAQYKRNQYLSGSSSTDAFGHIQLGGVAPTLAANGERRIRLQISLGIG